MNLYLVSQDINNGYDTYDAVVVCADDEDSARCAFPFSEDFYCEWVPESKKHLLKVQLIGSAIDGIDGVVLSSFNAG